MIRDHLNYTANSTTLTDTIARGEVASLNGMDRQTLSDWVHRYNAEGIAGLKSRKGPGRERFLTKVQRAELRALVIQGPNPDIHKVVRWRSADLRAEVARRWSVEVHESTVGVWLAELSLTRLQPWPVHPKEDEAAEVTFKNVWPAPSASDFIPMQSDQSTPTYPVLGT